MLSLKERSFYATHIGFLFFDQNTSLKKEKPRHKTGGKAKQTFNL